MKIKNLFTLLASAVLAVAVFFGSATTAVASAPTPVAASTGISSVIAKIPANLVVEQTVRLNDGNAVTLYYVKSGNYIEVYSTSSLKDYKIDDLLKMESTDFSLATRYEGQRVYRTTVAKARALVKKMVNAYL